MDLERRRTEWQVLKGLCRGLTDPLWDELWREALGVHPDCFTQTDLREAFKTLHVLHRLERSTPEDFPGILQQQLEAAGLGGFNWHSLFTPSPSDPDIRDLRERIKSLGQRRH